METIPDILLYPLAAFVTLGSLAMLAMVALVIREIFWP